MRPAVREGRRAIAGIGFALANQALQRHRRYGYLSAMGSRRL
ncbi:hypothetical protein X566_10565 [Afipia sp. P52-10]|jgi:hypothetical protein|nr:hypothetical protein X566_10565 [Afipia sp. P52-10]